VELCGDEPWFAQTDVRQRLRESVAEAHKEQKILVGAPADEVVRICPEDGRVLGAGAVLRLGGAHLGGYGESDVAYAYRQLSRALHPDKNPDLAQAPAAFHRLSEAADELRQGLSEQRAALQLLVGAMGGQATPQMLERPQEALFAEACRMLSAVSGVVGEGEVSGPAQGRAMAAFARSSMYYTCQIPLLLSEWFEKTQLLELYASVPMRTAYDCAPKRFRAHFLCLLNRAAVAEAKRFNDCVRGSWPAIMQTFPELGLWRDLREAIASRLWDSSMEPAPEPPPPKASNKSRSRSRSRRRSRSGSRRRGRDRSRSRSRRRRGDAEGDDGGRFGSMFERSRGHDQRDLAWETRWTTSDDQDRARYVDPGQQKVQKRDHRKAIETHPKTEMRACKWGRKWRSAISAILPSGIDSAAQLTDLDMRKLATHLWKDIAKWATNTDVERVFGLFRAEHQTAKTFGWDNKAEPTVARGMEPGTPQAEWSFVPVSDLLLVVGEGLVGITVEGVFGETPAGHKRLALAQCYKRSGDKRSRKGDGKKSDDRKATEKSEVVSRNGEAPKEPAKARSKWDVQA